MNTAPNARLSSPIHQSEPPSVSWKIPNATLITAPIHAAILSTRKRLATLSA